MHRSLSVLFVFVLIIGLLAPAAVGAAPAAEPAAPLSSALRISQVYGGGGGSTGTYKYDYVELFNSGASAATLTGYSLQYGSATGNFSSVYAFPAGTTIQPGRYLLAQVSSGTAGADLPVSPDLTTTSLAMSGGSGKVALANVATALGCGATATLCTLPDSRIVDSVSYGASNTAEGGATVNNGVALTSTQGAVRKGAGCTDTDNNNLDFDVVAGTSLIPRNSATAANICGGTPTDNPPTVSTTTPANNATNVTPGANVSITFSEAVTVSGAWYAISCATSGSPTAVVSGGPTTFTLNPDTDFSAGESCTVTVVAAQVADQDGAADLMAADYSFSFTTAASDPCIAAADFIHTVQGSGAASPVSGQTKTIMGLVVGDFQASTLLSGFFVQEEAADYDADPVTSEGIFVYQGSATVADVNVGDKVRVTGTVTEFNELTELGTLTNVTVCGTGNTVAPTTVSLPETTNGELERYEGMLITIPQTFTVDQNFFQGRYGQVTLSADGRMYNPTNGNGLGDTFDLNARRILVLDDGSSNQNPNPIPYIGTDNTLRAGDTLPGLTGLLDYGPINSDTTIRDYRVHPTTAVNITRVNARTAAPAGVGGSIKVSSFNVLNYFNGNGTGGGFPTSRGANTAAEFTRQRDKIIAALTAIDADVVGLMEIERDGFGATSAVQDLVNGLNAATAAGTYAFVAPATDPGTDEITVAMIYKPAKVTPAGAGQFYQTSGGGYSPLFDRPPLAQTFTIAGGAKFTVLVNHFKSKGSCPSSGVDTDQGDGQGCWNAKRVAQAQGLLGFISQLQTSAGDPDVLVIGDLNSYGAEDPIVTLTNGGLINQVAKIPAAVRYSYVFDGFAGYLDHGLTTPELDAQVSGQTVWHINADEPSVIDYNTEFKPQDLYAPTPYRSSDHDPVIIGLNLGATDTTAPETTIDTTPTNPSNSAAATFTFSSTETPSAFECSLDSAAFATCATPKTYTGLADGSHTFQVRAVDAAGNTDATPASYTWTVDTVAPETSIDTNPTNPANSASAAFSFSSAETPVTFECSLDSAAFATCATPQTYTGLADGSHTFQVRAVDAAGNTDATPASYTWVVDATPPETTIDSSPANPTTSTSADFTFSGTDAGTGAANFECKLDTAAFALCVSPQSYTGLAVGSHTFQVRAIDAAGNADATPASYTWQINANVGLSEVWVDAAWAGSASGAEVAPGKFFGINAFATIQAALDAVLEGGAVNVAAGAYAGGNVVTKNGLTIYLNGATVGHGSPAFTINADDVVIQGPGTLDGQSSGDPGVLVNAGADNFTLRDTTVTGWTDGVQVAGSVASLKIFGNYIHDNSRDGLHVDAAATIGGVVNIDGNLFKANGGAGVNNAGPSANLNVQYNSWGDLAGPSGPQGDGVAGSVDASNFTFLEPFMDMVPDTLAATRGILEGQSFDAKLKLDAAKLYGFTFKVTYDPAYLTLNSATFASPWTGGRCNALSATPGVISYRCQLLSPDAQQDLAGGTVATFNFTALPGTGNGPWSTYLDISHLPADTSGAAVGGAKVYVNNAGYGAASAAGRDITDTDDGQVNITGLAQYTGYVDLQGRTNESGATVQVFNQAAKTGATQYAGAVSVAGGAYTTSFNAPNLLAVGSEYWLVIDRPLYLPTTAVSASDYADSKLLSTRPTTAVSTVVLLGGDATDDNLIDLNDASCVGGGYGLPPATCGSAGSSDVNGDGAVNILDLSLMGGNYYATASPWTP